MIRQRGEPLSLNAGDQAPPASLRRRLADAEEALRAIRSGEVDTLVVDGKQGPRVFTLEGAERAYRLLIESMNEGAITLTLDKVILYANSRFSKMVSSPLETVTGGSFRRFLCAEDRKTLRMLLHRTVQAGAKIQVRLHGDDGSETPVQLSIGPTTRHGDDPATVGVVVTDLTEALRTEELLRALTHRVIHAQEVERSRVALELHDGITQMLCAIQLRSQALVASLSGFKSPSLKEATRLRDMAGKAAVEVERVSHDLRPGVLENLGLAPALRQSGREFSGRTGLSVVLTRVRLTGRLPAASELALYRIFQEALRNAERHAMARQIGVQLCQVGGSVHLGIKDDGVGFDPDHHVVGRKRKVGLGLLGMRERAASLGGTLRIISARRVGTEIIVHIPLRPKAPR